MPALVRGEASDELVPQHPRLAAGAVGYAGVRLVDDQQVRAAVPELLPQPGALDEVGGDHDVRVPVEQRLAEQQAAFEPADRRRQHQLRVNAELGPQLPLPLLGQRRAAEHRHSGSVALLQAVPRRSGPPRRSCRCPRRRRSASARCPAAAPSAAARAGRRGAPRRVWPASGTVRRSPGSRSAARSAAGPRWWPGPTSSGSGASKVAGATCSSFGNTPATSSSPPPSGRSTRKSGAFDCGSTTHSRPRAVTSVPTSYVAVTAFLPAGCRTRSDTVPQPVASRRRVR